MKLGGQNKTSREVLEQHRYRAIELRREGWKVNKIAEAFGVYPDTVSRWFVKKRKFGLDSLKSTKAKGKDSKISQENKKEIIKWLEKSAMEFGFETPLWTCNRVKQLIRKKLKITIHKSNIWEWLRKWNLTNQKPKRRAIERDEKAVRRWLKEEWPKIKEHRRRWQAVLYFQDESGVSLTAVMGKTWAPRGQTPIVKTTGKKGGLCVTSAISPAGRMLFRIENERVNAEMHIEFLIQLMAQHPNRKIIVIEDNAPSHTSGAVKSFVASNPNKIAIYNLPSYAPELNPDEHVWAYLKAHQLKNHQAQNKKELIKIVKNKMHSIQKQKKKIDSFFMQSVLF